MKGIQVFLMLATIVFCAGSSFAALPFPPTGVTYITHFPEDSGSSAEAHIYIWYDATGTLYIHFNPKGTYSLLYGAPSYIDPVTKEEKYTVLVNEFNFSVYHVISAPETFYLYSELLTDNFPTINQSSTLQFDTYGISSPRWVAWPTAFNGGQVYPVICNCDDSDKDGVPDAWDKCAKTPLTAVVNEKGCPAEGKGGVVVVPLFDN